MTRITNWPKLEERIVLAVDLFLEFCGAAPTNFWEACHLCTSLEQMYAS